MQISCTNRLYNGSSACIIVFMGRRAVIPDAIIKLMHDESSHAWTLEDIKNGLNTEGVSADFSSVFRAMERLESDRFVSKIDVDDGKSRFELLADHHDHVLCESCGSLLPAPCGLLDATLADLELETGFTITGHSLIIKGVCRDCQDVADATVNKGAITEGTVRRGEATATRAKVAASATGTSEDRGANVSLHEAGRV